MTHRLAFVCAGIEGAPTDGYSKDLVNFVKISLKLGCIVKIFFIVKNSDAQESLTTYFSNIGIERADMHFINARASKSFLTKFKINASNFIPSNYSFHKIIKQFNPNYLICSPFHYMCTYADIKINGRKIFYVGDSPSCQMTRLSAAEPQLFRKFKYYLSSIIYGYYEKLSEKRNFLFVTVSDEMSKIMSRSVSIERIFAIKPSFEFSVSSRLVNKQNRIVFLRPNSIGLNVITEFIHKFGVALNCQIVIIGGVDPSLWLSPAVLHRIEWKPFVDDLNEYIATSLACIITDLDGIGFSNRAANVLCCNTILLSTKNGVRGLGIQSGINYFEFDDASSLHQGVFEVLNNIDSFKSMLIRNTSLQKDFGLDRLKQDFVKLLTLN